MHERTKRVIEKLDLYCSNRGLASVRVRNKMFKGLAEALDAVFEKDDAEDRLSRTCVVGFPKCPTTVVNNKSSHSIKVNKVDMKPNGSAVIEFVDGPGAPESHPGLKPCPACGSEAHAPLMGSNGRWEMMCKDEQCWFEVFGPTKVVVVARWNRRPLEEIKDD